MRYLLGTSFALAMLITAIMTTPTFAITCTDRKGVCLAYCDKHYHRAPKCTAVCEDLLNECMSSGCWESKITAKRCGISKR